MTDEEFHQLLRRPEELHPDLEDCLVDEGKFGFALDHPLVIALGVDRERAGLLNERYRSKAAALEQASKDGDWSQYVWLHERPYRVEALMNVVDELDNRQYWELVADVWIDSENIFQSQIEWQDLWSDGRSHKTFAMNAKEREEFASLPRDLTIYRGVGEGDNVEGLSWTLDREKAIWFARRHGGGAVLTASARKCDVHAFFHRRNEQEVVIDNFTIVGRDPMIKQQRNEGER